MSTELQSDTLNETALDELVCRARSLYSLPAVASKVIELTSNPQVDAQALKECIEADPALAAKILRVVNSSLFGLSREVCDLNQALALLGTKPLKLLVLGFSLPDRLFSKVAQDQLDWYWSTTLSRAVAAREISEQLFERPGDDAFLAGLLQDIGVLVLLGELKEPYAAFLSRAIDEHVDLQRLELASLGFDHRTLSAKLLEHWNMPKLLVDSISETRDFRVLARKKTPAAELARILHLAGLIAELVGHNRLSVLPELMEAGDAYCDLDKDGLNKLVALLQPKVEQLAEVLSLELPSGFEYTAIVIEAHRQMSELTESVAGLLSRSAELEDQVCVDMAEDVAHLRSAVDSFLHEPAESTERSNCNDDPAASVEVDCSEEIPKTVQPLTSESELLVQSLYSRLAVTVGRCRSKRQPISVLLLEIAEETSGDSRGQQILNHILATLHRTENKPGLSLETITPHRTAVVLPGWERQQAVRLAEEILGRVEKAKLHLNQSGASLDHFACAGVASVALPSKNFSPPDLLETAGRCLAAAQSSGNSMVKSLELF